MAISASQTQQAQRVYSTMVRALRKKDWKFEAKDDDLTIVSNYTGDDMSIHFIIEVDAKREAIRFLAPLSFHIAESKRVDAAIAVSVANYGLVNGSFDYDINDGEVRFRLTTSYCGCEVGEDFFMDMMSTALLTTDKYNARFLMLSKGVITLQQFIDQDKS